MLDNEAIQALLTTGHPKRRKLMGHLEVVAKHRARVLVPVAVRVEAGWDRRSPQAAGANRMPVVDWPLTTGGANVAAELAAELAGLSVADASIGAVLEEVTESELPVTVLTSDQSDMQRIAGYLNVAVTVSLI